MKLLDKILQSKKIFEGVTEYDSVNLSFICSECINKIDFNLECENSNQIQNLDLSVLEDMLNIDLIKKSSIFQSHLGDFSIFNLFAYYQIVECNNCSKKFIITYGQGEVQNGRNVLYISGICRFE